MTMIMTSMTMTMMSTMTMTMMTMTMKIVTMPMMKMTMTMMMVDQIKPRTNLNVLTPADHGSHAVHRRNNGKIFCQLKLQSEALQTIVQLPATSVGHSCLTSINPEMKL